MISDGGGWAKPPTWLEDPIRGLAFWLGWRHVRFPHYPLKEGDISGELIALIQGFRPREIALMPEARYSEIAVGSFGQRRADLVVGELQRGEAGESLGAGATSTHHVCLVEVRKVSAPAEKV